MTSTNTTPISIASYPQRHFDKVVEACNKFDGDLSTTWKFYMLDNSRPVGFMREEFANNIQWGIAAFKVNKEAKTIHLVPTLVPGEDATERCQEEFTKLCGINKTRFVDLEKWLNTGVHLNVYTVIGQQRHMWVSQRSMNSTYPGMLDQTVAGGMDYTDDYNPWATLEHEASEEAKLVLDKATEKMTYKGVEVGLVRGPFRMTLYDKKDKNAGGNEGTLEPSVCFVFDMEVPADFVMVPGEDQSFQLKSMKEVVDQLGAGQWKPNSGLATLESLLRNSYIVDGGDGMMVELQKKLQRELPMRTAHCEEEYSLDD
ncbi:NUDIX hydrolase domain protein [Akanthomyces lecanii RCEF 1005]|uniref:NUDIX hydrolase domain protein n=1 Tax=Akanthomyces lecanii RCEF 1005 TaxID=1081108 RepID=A0A168HMR3_CORDF|nr:NUDIX hydrolase domain protein [Akanthomyces lecanii RCEF 1005]